MEEGRARRAWQGNLELCFVVFANSAHICSVVSDCLLLSTSGAGLEAALVHADWRLDFLLRTERCNSTGVRAIINVFVCCLFQSVAVCLLCCLLCGCSVSVCGLFLFV